MNVKIVPITISDLESYKQIELESLKAEPNAFDTSYQEAIKWDNDKWLEQLKECIDPDKSISFFIMVKNDIAGFAIVNFSWKIKKRHIADFDTLYIKKEYRCKGLATILVNSVIEILKSKYHHIVKVSLCVYEDQTSAIKLYKKLGFKIHGKSERGLFSNGRFFDQYDMIGTPYTASSF